ncbi:MAG: glutamate synthase-related protein, partial [Pseudomonadota bacterium]
MNSRKDFRFPEVLRTPSRFRNPIGKYRLNRTNACTACGKCVEICPYGVHVARRGRVFVENPHLCVGPECPEPCHRACPEEALSLKNNPDFDALGDFRWPGDLLAGTWYMAEFGKVPSAAGLEYKIGASGGGFDRLRLVFRKDRALKDDIDDDDVDMGVELNRRGDHAHRIRIEVPFYGGGMSYGSVSITTMLSRMKAATALGTFCCTGEGGYPD